MNSSQKKYIDPAEGEEFLALHSYGPVKMGQAKYQFTLQSLPLFSDPATVSRYLISRSTSLSGAWKIVVSTVPVQSSADTVLVDVNSIISALFHPHNLMDKLCRSGVLLYLPREKLGKYDICGDDCSFVTWTSVISLLE